MASDAVVLPGISYVEREAKSASAVRRWVFGAPLRKFFHSLVRSRASKASESDDTTTTSDERRRRLSSQLAAVQGELAVFYAVARAQRTAQAAGMQSLRTRFNSAVNAEGRDGGAGRSSEEDSSRSGEPEHGVMSPTSRPTQLQAVWRAVLDESSRVVEAA